MSTTIRAKHLILKEHFNKAFAVSLVDKADRLGFNPDFLVAVIAFESGFTFSPAVRNPRSGATGLIQFMPQTAKALGTTVEELAQMTPVEQLQKVYEYFLPYKGKLQTLEDVYMAVLWPRAIGRDLNYILFAEADGKAYRWNAGLDRNKDGRVTKAEAAARVRRIYDEGILKRQRAYEAI